MGFLDFLYKTIPGRILLRPLISKPISDFSGIVLDSKISKKLIKNFAYKNHIELDDYILDGIDSFNDFFCRRIKPELRPIDYNESNLICPCDGLLKVLPIVDGAVISVKQSNFDIDSLLDNHELAKHFDGGYCLVYRLCVNHYHRYCYFDTGIKSQDVVIPGKYHTVRPIALSNRPVFIENARQYTVIDSPSFGKCVQMEIGAMLVGRIVNNTKADTPVKRGDEKGHFEYGGSTIIVLIPKDSASINQDILDASNQNIETPVIMGQTIGKAIS